MSREFDASIDQLVANFRNVVASTESLLHATTAAPGVQAEAARERIQDTLRNARDQLERAEAAITGQARAAIGATDQFVRKHPWESAAVAAAVGVIVGVLLSRK